MTEFGGPEVLRLVEVADPAPGPCDLLVDVTYIGVNFRDIHERTGTYPSPVPFVPGSEAAGVVRSVGEGVDDAWIGARVAWHATARSYAEVVVVPVAVAIAVPDDIDDRAAASVLAQGMTADYLTTSVYKVEPGTVALVHAGAGGTGRLITQMVKAAGGRVVATASTPARCQVATDAGADLALLSGSDLADEIAAFTGGLGVDVAYDGVGAPTIDSSLSAIRTRGVLALYGTSGGDVGALPVAPIFARSLFVTRPKLPDYTGSRDELEARSASVFAHVRGGSISVLSGGIYRLDQAAAAHSAIEGRTSTGKLLLTTNNQEGCGPTDDDCSSQDP